MLFMWVRQKSEISDNGYCNCNIKFTLSFCNFVLNLKLTHIHTHITIKIENQFLLRIVIFSLLINN
jgi:hypothetical protein